MYPNKCPVVLLFLRLETTLEQFINRADDLKADLVEFGHFYMEYCHDGGGGEGNVLPWWWWCREWITAMVVMVVQEFLTRLNRVFPWCREWSTAMVVVVVRGMECCHDGGGGAGNGV